MKSYTKAEIVMLEQVLSGEVPYDDIEFQQWLSQNGNKKLYDILDGTVDCPSQPGKEEMYGLLAKSLHLERNRSKHNWAVLGWCSAAAVLICLVVFNYVVPQIHGRMVVKAQNENFEPGSRVAFLSTDHGEVMDLSSDFIKKNTDGTVVTNHSGDMVSFKEENRIGRKEYRPQMQTLTLPKGGEYFLELADGTKVFLNSESVLEFPSKFEGNERKVKLRGEAFFEVSHTGTPFCVEVPGMEISVTGTRFNVRSYSDEIMCDATLVDGSITVSVDGAEGCYDLVPSENIHMDKGNGDVSVKTVNTALYTSWVDGKFMFNNQRLEDIFLRLSRWYNFEVEYARDEIKDMHFTGSAKKNWGIDYLLNQISDVAEIKYARNENVLVLY